MKYILIFIAGLSALRSDVVLANEGDYLVTINGASIIIGNKEPASVLLGNKECHFLSEATSRQVKEVSLTLVSVTCGNIIREITPEDSPNPISVTEIKVLKSAIVMGVVNELLPGTKVNAADWLKFQVDIDN